MVEAPQPLGAGEFAYAGFRALFVLNTAISPRSWQSPWFAYVKHNTKNIERISGGVVLAKKRTRQDKLQGKNRERGKSLSGFCPLLFLFSSFGLAVSIVRTAPKTPRSSILFLYSEQSAIIQLSKSVWSCQKTADIAGLAGRSRAGCRTY